MNMEGRLYTTFSLSFLSFFFAVLEIEFNAFTLSCIPALYIFNFIIIIFCGRVLLSH